MTNASSGQMPLFQEPVLRFAGIGFEKDVFQTLQLKNQRFLFLRNVENLDAESKRFAVNWAMPI